MAIQVQKIGDIVEMMVAHGNIPKKMEFELSNDETFYRSKLYYDFYDKGTDTTREGYVLCRTRLNFTHDFLVISDSDKDKTIFTITIPDEDES